MPHLHMVIKAQLQRQLKVEAAKEGKTIRSVVEKLITDYIKKKEC